MTMDLRQYIVMALMAILVYSFLWVTDVHAMDIKCYSSGHLIYSGTAPDVFQEGGMISFLDHKTGRITVPMADCMVFIKPSEIIIPKRHKHLAHKK